MYDGQPPNSTNTFIRTCYPQDVALHVVKRVEEATLPSPPPMSSSSQGGGGVAQAVMLGSSSSNSASSSASKRPVWWQGFNRGLVQWEDVTVGLLISEVHIDIHPYQVANLSPSLPPSSYAYIHYINMYLSLSRSSRSPRMLRLTSRLHGGVVQSPRL